MAYFLLFRLARIYSAEEIIHGSKTMEKRRKSNKGNTKKPDVKKITEYVEPDDFSTLRDVPIYWEPPKKQTEKKPHKRHRRKG